MNLRTFYRLFYKHRIGKASFFLRLYIFIVFPLKYLINIFYFEKKVNLDLYKDNFSYNLDFEYKIATPKSQVIDIISSEYKAAIIAESSKKKTLIKMFQN